MYYVLNSISRLSLFTKYFSHIWNDLSDPLLLYSSNDEPIRRPTPGHLILKIIYIKLTHNYNMQAKKESMLFFILKYNLAKVYLG